MTTDAQSDPQPVAESEASVKELAEKLSAISIVGANRCPICRWQLAASANHGCVIGNCAFRADDEQTQGELSQARQNWRMTADNFLETLAAFAESRERAGMEKAAKIAEDWGDELDGSKLAEKIRAAMSAMEVK